MITKHQNPRPDDLTADDIPLRLALAAIISVDIAQGRSNITTKINEIYSLYADKGRRYFEQMTLLGSCIFCGVLFSIYLAIFQKDMTNVPTFPLLAILGFMVLKQMKWHSFQYGDAFPYDPVNVEHEIISDYDSFLKELKVERNQASELPHIAYYKFRFGNNVHVHRRIFFGKLRYFIFAEHFFARRLVKHPIFPFIAPKLIYISRATFQRLHAAAPPKIQPNEVAEIMKSQKGGRNVKFRYVEAIVNLLLDDPLLANLNLEDKGKMTDELAKRIKHWFVTSERNDVGYAPEARSIRDYAETVCDALLARMENSKSPNEDT